MLKKCGPLSQLQIHELTYCINCREQGSGMGSPIARCLGRNVRGAIPNSLDRNINWKMMIENRALQHQKRVEKKGRKPKEMYEIGEECLVQDINTHQWTKRGTVISVGTAQDGTVVSYLLNINGFETARHRRYMRKLTMPDDIEVQRTAQEETGLEREGRKQLAHHVEPQLRRSERLRAVAQDGL